MITPAQLQVDPEKRVTSLTSHGVAGLNRHSVKGTRKNLLSPFYSYVMHHKKGKTTCLTIGVTIALVFLITPTMAYYNFSGWPVVSRTNGTVNGGVFIDYEPWDGSKDLSLSTLVPNGTVRVAYLYTGIWGGTENYHGWVNVTFNNVTDCNGLGPVHLQGKNDTNQHVWCTTHGKHWMFYNVTNLTDAGIVNTVRVRKNNETAGAFDGRVYGIILIVVYEGGDNPKNTQYWINDGNDALHYDAPVWPPVGERNTGTTGFAGTEVDWGNVTRANLTILWLTAYDPPYSEGLKFNDIILDTSMITSNTFDIHTWDVTNYVASSGNGAWYTRGDDTFINVPNVILVLESDPTDRLDTGSPEHPYPSIAGIHNGTLTVTNTMTINTMYTYHCAGTGGHTEFVRIWNETTGDCAEAHWDGYRGDYLNISFNRTFTLQKGVTYNYTIQTGSYPQILHETSKQVTGGTLTCTKFVDANGEEHDNWIPAFNLYYVR